MMNKLFALTSRIPRPKLFKVYHYSYGHRISRNLSLYSQICIMLGIIVYSVSLFLSPAIASRGVIEHYSAVAVAEQTQTGTSNNWANVTGTANTGTTASTNGWVDSANLTAGDDYLVMVWAEHSTNNANGRSGVRVAHGATPFTQSQAIEETDQTGAAFKTPYFWFTVWTAVADEDLEVQFFNATNTNTASVEDVTLVVMDAEDLLANNELIYDIDTAGGTNSTTFTMRSSITWTPAAANDTWWVAGYVQHDSASTQDNTEGRFDIDNGTFRGTHSIEGEDTADTPLYGLGWAQQFTAASHTIEVETREDVSTNGGSEWDSTGLFALRLNGFETFKAYGVAGAGTALSANNVYVEQGNVDHQQLSEGNFLMAAGAAVDDNGGLVNSKLTLAGTDITDPTGGYSHNNADIVPTTLADMQIDAALGLSDIDFDAQRTATVTNPVLNDRWVVAFSMERAGPPAELSLDGYIFENDDGTTTGFQLGSAIEECEEEEEEANEEDITITNGADMGNADDSELTLFSAFNDAWLGHDGSEKQDTWMRFSGVDIPQGTEITAAYITFPTTSINDSGSILSNIYAVDEDNHAAPTTYGQWTTDDGLHTTASTVWDFTVTASPLQTPDISAVIQEIIDRGGWSSGNAIGIHIDDDGTSSAVQQFDALPTLHIEYDTVGTGQVETTGTVTSFQNGNDTGNQAITVPADTDFLVLVVGGWFDDLDNHFNGTLSIDGDNLTFGPRADQDGGENAAAMLYLANPSTGSQTLSWTWSNGDPSEGLTFMIRYLKGVDTVDPFRDTGADQGAGGTRSTGAMTGQTGDYAIAGMNGYDGTDYNVTWTGATEIFEAFDGDGNSALAEETAVAGNITITTETEDSGGIVGAVIKPAAVSTSVEATHLTTGTSGTNGTSANTASITPSANKLILASVVTGIEDADPPPVTPTLSGNSLTWVVVHSEPQDNDSRLTVFRAMGGSPTTGAVTISTGSESQHAWAWSISEFDNVDTSGTNGSGAIGLVDGTAAEDVTGLTVNLSAFESSTNAAYGAFGLHGDTAVTPGTGFTELGEDGVTDAERDLAIQTEWQDVEDTSIDATWTTEDGIAVGLEIRAASGEGGGGGEECEEEGEGGGFPQVDGTTTYDSGGGGISPITLPSVVDAGDLLLMWFTGEDENFTAPSEWSEIDTLTHSGNPIGVSIFAKVAEGDEDATTVSVGGTTEDDYYAITYRIVNWKGSLDGLHTAMAQGDSTTPNPPNLDAGASRQHLWIAATSVFQSGNNFTPPANYTNLLMDSNESTGAAQRELEAQAEDPGSFSMADGESWITGTIAIEPGAGGGGSTLDRAVGANGDDGSVIPDLPLFESNNGRWGQNWIDDSEDSNMFLRFPNITIPQGAVITNAYVTFTAINEGGDGSGETINAVIAGVDEDNHVAPTTTGEFNTDNGMHTTATVQFDQTRVDAGSFDSPDISSIVQEIIDRGGWASGNALGIHIDDDGTNPAADQALQEVAVFEDGSGYPVLHIEYEASGGGGGTFPNYLDTTETTSTNFSTGNVNYPATVDAGDLLLLTYTGSDTISSVGDGFTLIKQRIHTTGDYSTEAYALVADGSEDGGTVSVTLATSANLALFHMLRIEGGTWGGTIATDIDVSTAAASTGGDPNPDSVTAGWGSDKNLFVAIGGQQDDDDFTSGPSNYTNFTSSEDGVNNSHGTATRELEADADDPGIFSHPTGTDPWGAMTLVIKPAGIGSTTTNGDDFGQVEGGTQLAGSEFSSGQIPTGVRQGDRMNLRVHLTNSGGTLKDTSQLALFYDRGDGIWSKVKRQQPPRVDGGGGCDDSTWICETVVSTGDVGRYNSMAIDRLGHPWISYRDETNTELKIAKYVGSGGSGCALSAWSCQTIDSGTDSGEHTSIALGRESDVWISYWDDNSNDLRVANFVTAGGNCDDLYSGSDAWDCITVDSTGDVGEYSSISLDRFGNPWVSYYDATNTRLKVAEYIGGTSGTGCASTAWNCTIVENTGVEGQWSSLAFDEDGQPWVSYYHSSSTELKVARFVNGGGSGCASTAWTCWIVDTDNTSGEYSSIGFSPNGTAYVAYYNQTGANLRVAQYAGSGGDCDTLYGGNDAWECTEVDTTGSVGTNASIAFDPAGNPWVSYRDATNNMLRLTRFVGSGGSGCADSAWTCGAIESVTSAANGMSSLAFDPNGMPWISHFDETDDNLRVAYLNTRAGEILSAPSQHIVNNSSILASRADMTSVSDTSNGNSADCIATANWNDGLYFEHENGGGLSLPDGLGPDQCTEVMWTLDMSQASPGTTYRFIVATDDSFEPDHGLWRGPAVVNEYPTITTDSAEASVYRYAKDNLLQFANCNTDTTWGCGPVDATDGGGQYTSTGFDPAGNPWVSYYETTGGDLKVARYVGSGGTGCNDSAWHCEVLDSTNDTGLYTSLAFDQNGAAWISYYDTTDDDLKVARYVGSGGTGCDLPAWECGVVDSAGNTGQYTSLAFDASGSAWITYYDATNSDLDFTRYVGTAGVGCNDIAWTCSTIESANDIGSHSSLAFDASGKPWVSYYDATNDNLRTAHYTGLGDSATCGSGGGVSGPPTVQTTNTFNSTSVGTKAVNLPSGIQAGDLIIVYAGSEAGDEFDWTTGAPAGYTVSTYPNDNDAGTMLAYRWADGTEGSTVNWTIDSIEDEANAWITYRISGAANPGTQAPEVTSALGSSTTPNPPNLVPTGQPKDMLYLAMAGGENVSDFTAFPSGYSNSVESVSNGGGGTVTVGSAEKQEAASTGDDPGTFTMNGNFAWSAQTVGIHPGTGGGGGGGETNWDCVTVDATDDVGQYSSIAVDANGNPWVSYYDATGGNLEVAEYVGSGGDCDTVGAGSDEWECSTVDSTDNVGQFTSIAFDAAGTAWVSYLDFTNTDLNAARYVGSGGDCNSSAWDCMDISSSTAGNNTHSAIAFDLSGTPWISHASTSANSLNIASLHLPPTKPTADIIIPFATRSAIKGDARFRLHPGTSPSTNPYGTCGAATDLNGYCGLYHPEGYRDSMVADSSERPLYTLATRFDSNAELPTALAVFQSSVAPSTENVILQVYRFGSTNAWETLTTYNSAGCTSTTCTIRAMPSGTPSDYYEADGSQYWVYFRIYQTESSGELDFQLDHFTAEVPVKFMRGGRVFRETITDPLGW